MTLNLTRRAFASLAVLAPFIAPARAAEDWAAIEAQAK